MVETNVLKGIQFFSEFTDDELAVIAGVVVLKEFETGDTIFKEAEEGDALYILKKGEVKACRMGPNGELVTLTLMKAGEIFGEMSFLDGSVRSASIVAISKVESYMLDKASFDSIVDSHPRVMYKFMKNIVYAVHSIVTGMNTRYVEMMNYMWGRRR
jgi:CRP/FNR family cyclic AMP-dependent transcriptional regulator